MKKLIALYLIANISLMGVVAQGYYTYCDIVERNKKVEMKIPKANNDILHNMEVWLY